MTCSQISGCRCCGERELTDVLHLGEQPLANALPARPDKVQERFPLSLAYCPSCSLVQIRETVDKLSLFRSYFWVTGTSSSARRFADEFHRMAVEGANLKPGDLVVEVASNDGTFLEPFARAGFRTVGVDPAENIAQIALAKDIETIAAFWNVDTAAGVAAAHGRAALVFARNVVAHAADLHDVVEGMSRVMEDDATGIVEVHYAGAMLAGLQYDAIYHEHLCYFTAQSLSGLLSSHDLQVFHVAESPIGGGGLVVFFGKGGRRPTAQMTEFLAAEKAARLDTVDVWCDFGRRCLRHRDETMHLLADCRNSCLVGFGASARSSTYLNFCEIRFPAVRAIIDNNRLKQGRYTAGSAIPIIACEEGMRMGPDIVFVLAWNFFDEIVQQCSEAGFSGSFLVPFPGSPKIVGPM